MLNRRLVTIGLGGLAIAAAMRVRPARASDALRLLSKGGVVVLIRHAAAPGTGDPPGFRLDRCDTQRNLSEAGRHQASELGRKLREAGISVVAARSSRWCRALETARLAFPHLTVEPEPALDSFFGERERRTGQTDAALMLVRAWEGRPGVLALVTHQVNITALTGVFPGEGEMVVVRPADAAVIGKLRL